MVFFNGDSVPQRNAEDAAASRSRARAARPSMPSEPLDSQLQAGLDALLRAFEYAADLDCDVWDFAIDVRELKAAGLSTSDLRWLVRKDYAEHARELTLPSDSERSFRRTPGHRFGRHTCFVLTSRGATFVRQMKSSLPPPRVVRIDGAQPEPPAAHVQMPHWDGDLLELRIDGTLVKQFKVPAPNQEMILAAFEEEGWPPRIDDPLPPHPQQDPKRRLHDTINSLNRNHKVPRIRFFGDGSGQGVRWTTVEDEN